MEENPSNWFVHLLLQNPPVSFTLYHLPQDTSYRLLLFAVNPKGRSEPTVLEEVQFKGPVTYTGQWVRKVSEGTDSN